MDEKRRAWLNQPTRMRMLAAAEECFARDGYDAARVDDIASLASVSKSHLYYHFGSKARLLECLVELRTDEMLRAKDSLFTERPLAELITDQASVAGLLQRAVTEILVPRRQFLRIMLVEVIRNPAASGPFFAALDSMLDDSIARFSSIGVVPDETVARSVLHHLGVLPCLYAVALGEDTGAFIPVLATLEVAITPVLFSEES